MINIRMTIGSIMDGNYEAVRDATRASVKSMVEVWKIKYLPLHFQHAGSTKYQYVPRQGMKGSNSKWHDSYSHQKLRKFGHTKPQVWSGTTRGQVMREPVQVRNNGEDEYVGFIRLPRVYQVFSTATFKKDRTRTRWAQKGPKPLLAEITTVTKDEIEDLESSGTEHWVTMLTHMNRSRQRIYNLGRFIKK